MLLENDKFLVVSAVVILGIGSLWAMGAGAKEIVLNAYSGLFGIVTGYALRAATTPSGPKVGP